MQVALYLLDMHGTTDSESRRDPVRVARAITEMVSHTLSYDDDYMALLGDSMRQSPLLM